MERGNIARGVGHRKRQENSDRRASVIVAIVGIARAPFGSRGSIVASGGGRAHTRKDWREKRGGIGTGSGRLGAIVALVVELIGMVLGGLALARSCRTN
jgi:hypothetical protein